MAKMFTLIDLNRDIIGKIKPTGSHELDLERLENVEDHSEITRNMVMDLIGNVKYSRRPEASIKVISTKSIEALEDLQDMIKDALDNK